MLPILDEYLEENRNALDLLNQKNVLNQLNNRKKIQHTHKNCVIHIFPFLSVIKPRGI